MQRVLNNLDLKYNKLNQLEMFSEQAGGETHKTEFVYDRDNRVTGITYDGSAHKVNYTYDELGRMASRVAECGADAGKLTSTYEYVDGGYGTNSTTPLVKKIAQNGVSFEYEYDSRGNIISEKRGNLTTTYQYDALGQLIRVNDPHENATWVYNYDRGGNITSKVKYAYTTGVVGTALETIPYVYGDSNWKDKLTSYNGQTITYDAIGNPTNDGTWTYTWQAGRQLKQMSAEGTSVSFKYDHNGMRVQKVVEQSWYPETTNYTYHGKLLTHMTVDYTDFDEVAHQDKMHFFYDAQSRPVKVEFNGTVYTYLPNLQGDIVGILDNAGTLVVEYKYDAWGKPLNTTGTLADTLGKRNPFRYRGYAYDEETGLYYLRSRYYDSIQKRFINADEFISLKKGILLHNLYAYCVNTPVISDDKNGHLWKVITALATAVNVIVKAAKVVVPMIGAEIQLIVNRYKAKKALEDIEQERKDFMMYSYGGAANAMFEGYFGKYEWFYSQVNHNAPMDYKQSGRRPWWALGCDTFYFRGRMITFEEYGNINYGYVGKALGISDWVLFAGGGYAAITGGGDVSSRFDYFFDSEEDHDNIAWGIEIYNQTWDDE